MRVGVRWESCPSVQCLTLSLLVSAGTCPELTPPPETLSPSLVIMLSSSVIAPSWSLQKTVWHVISAMRAGWQFLKLLPTCSQMSNCWCPNSPRDPRGRDCQSLSWHWARLRNCLHRSLQVGLRMFTTTINVQNTWVGGKTHKYALVVAGVPQINNLGK